MKQHDRYDIGYKIRFTSVHGKILNQILSSIFSHIAPACLYIFHGEMMIRMMMFGYQMSAENKTGMFMRG